jgi:hypothetical protein
MSEFTKKAAEQVIKTPRNGVFPNKTRDSSHEAAAPRFLKEEDEF